MDGPLAGYRVVDMGWVLAGALPGMILADLGAEVVKVETRKRLDNMRQGRPIIGDQPDPEQQPMFHNVCRSKLSVTVDITQRQGQELVKELVAVSDGVIENYSAGVLERFGLSYADLRRVHPDIVMVSIAGVDREGPFREMRAYAETVTSMAGLDSTVGYHDTRPLGMRLAYGDISAALHAVTVMLAALQRRRETGQGAHALVSMVGSAMATMGQAFLEYQMTGRDTILRGNYDPTMPVYNNYPCRDEDTWVSIAVRDEEEWRGLCQAMGDPAWTREPPFSSAASRLGHRRELDARISQWTRQQEAMEATTLLQQHGVAAFPVLKAEQRYFDPHYQERRLYQEVEHPSLGVEPIFNLPWKMETPPARQCRAPLLGEHNRYIFSEVLGMPEAEVIRLEKEEVLV